MLKTVKKFLIYILAFSFVFASYFLVPQKAQAQNPPQPQTIFKAKFTDSGLKNMIVTATIGNAPVDFHFSQSITPDPMPTDSIINIEGSSGSIIHVFTLTDTAYKCQFAGNNFGQPDQPYFLFVSQTTGSSPYFIEGLGTYLSQREKYFRFRDSHELKLTCHYETTIDPIIIFTNYANTERRGTVVSAGADIGDITQYCNDLNSDWGNLKIAIRNFMVPVPGSPDQPNWTKETSYAWRTADTNPVYLLAKDLIPPLKSLTDESYAYDTIIQFYVTPTGKAVYDTIGTTSKRIGDKLIQLRSKYGDNVWPDNCTKLKKFKIDLALENNSPTYYGTLGEFAIDLDKILANFYKFVNTTITPISTSEKCGNLLASASNTSKILGTMFCEIGVFLHNIASSIMSKAVEWLTAAIGIDTSQESMPTPMNLSVQMKMSNSGKYQMLKSAGSGIWVKVKKADEDATINAAVQLSNFNDGNLEVNCVFTTAQNIPTNWTAVEIYGGTGNTGAQLFNFTLSPYPSTGTSIVNSE